MIKFSLSGLSNSPVRFSCPLCHHLHLASRLVVRIVPLEVQDGVQAVDGLDRQLGRVRVQGARGPARLLQRAQEQDGRLRAQDRRAPRQAARDRLDQLQGQGPGPGSVQLKRIKYINQTETAYVSLPSA